jgi:quinoprotein glucose dehydrogenase
MTTAYGSVVAVALLGTALVSQTPPRGDWPAYGGGPAGTHYSPLAEITRDNVTRLERVWVYRTGDYFRDRGRFEANPLVVDGTLYISTPLGTVIALDPARGSERWRYDPHLDTRADYGDFANRGVATWRDRGRSRGAPCRRRVFVATVDARLIALDAATGQPCVDFGERGTVDLARGLRHAPAYHWEYGVTAPPAIIGDLVVVGSAVADNQRVEAPEGIVRAFDARTGALRWSWDPIPRSPADPAYATWQGPQAHETGAANAWAPLSVDQTMGLVFVPVGSASPDFYGGERLGANRYANSVVALRAADGTVAWSFQVVHHDLWDYDVPAQPALFELHRAGRVIAAVAVATKMGHLFVLDRRTGKPIFPVTEHAVPASDVPGESAFPTQPFPSPSLRLVPESLRPDQAFGTTDAERAQCRDRIASLRYDGVFTPPSLRGTIIWPGNIGGLNWSGLAVDERRDLVLAPANRLAMVVTLIPRDSVVAARRAHPGTEISDQRGTPFAMMREVLWSSHRIPCTPPPWGTLAAVDLRTQRVAWQVPLGHFPGLGAIPDATHWGSPNLGGAIVTAGGLVFVAGTLDQTLRAFDEESGRELWHADLPAGAHALPATYLAHGRQYVVIAAGGHDRLGTTMGDFVLAYALPGAPAADTAAPSLSGSYEGELRVGDARVGIGLTLRVLGDSIAGSITHVDSIQVTAAPDFERNGRALMVRFPFTYPARRCEGVVAAQGELWNGGRLLEGDLTVTGSCSNGAAAPGSFALWRHS